MTQQAETPQALYRKSIVIDCLNGSALTPAVIARLRAAKVTALNLTAVQIGQDFRGALSDLAKLAETVERHSKDLVIAREAGDIRRAKAEGRTAILIGLQDAEPVGRDLERLRLFAELGVRVIQLTHNRQNYIGTGCAERDSGLTRFGRKVVEEMNRLGLVIDLSHCGPQTTLDAIEVSALPVACTHSNPRAIADSLRNKEDAVIRRLAAREGLIGIATWAPIVYRGNGRRPALSDVLDCFQYAIDLVGPQSVAIGSDLCEEASPTPEDWARVYGPGGSYPEITGGLGAWYGFETVNAEGLDTITDLPDLVAGLAERGLSPAELRGIMGENFLSLFERVRARAA